MIDTLHNQERRQHKTIAAHTLDCRGLFAIARLKLFASTTPVGTRDNHAAADNAHHEACFVEVVKIGILNRVFRAHVGHQTEPRVYRVRISAKGSLEVVGTRKTRFQL